MSDTMTHLHRVTERQKQYDATSGMHPCDAALALGKLQEAIMQAGESGATLEQIKDARKKVQGISKPGR